MSSPSTYKDIVLQALPQDAAIDDDYVDYISESVAATPAGPDFESVLLETVGPILESFVSESDVEAAIEKICAGVAALAKPSARVRRKGDYAVQLDEFILGFGGKMLLEATQLHLKRGHRYALIGQNGVGKTTLMTRMAKKDIRGFPKDQVCVYVKHEVQGDLSEPVIDYLKRDTASVDVGAVRDALRTVGFDDALMESTVSQLSGGWRMRLAISRTLLLDADILLLDEPTNHLDVNAVEWLIEYLNHLDETTVMIVSHDVPFLKQTVTDVIHFNNKKLTYVPGGLDAFLLRNPVGSTPSSRAHSPSLARANGADGTVQAEDSVRQVAQLEFKFPTPGLLDGVTSSSRAIMRLSKISYHYEGSPEMVLKDVNVKLTLASRIAIIGPNGAGKSTLLRLLVGELNPLPGNGEVWKHFNLRVAYIAQHTLFHLEDYLLQTPIEYIQERFRAGTDAEIQSKGTLKLSEAEEERKGKFGEVEAIQGRRMRHRELEYEIKRVGIRETFYHPLAKLKSDSGIMKLIKQYDEKLAAIAAGVDRRPLLSTEIKKHLSNFGLSDEFATGKIERLSGGQRTRLVFAAAMWPRPHVLAMDEPTNYLDREALGALSEAVKKFKGAVVMVTHNKQFCDELCKEWWQLENGTCTVRRNPVPDVA